MSSGTNIGRRMEVVALLLEHEARTGRGLGVVAVANQLEREKSLVSRTLASLAESGLVIRDPQTLEFTVGAELLSVAARAGDQQLLATALPEVRRLASDLGERAGLMVLQRDQVLTVETAVSEGSVHAVGWAGRTTPIHCTASGRVLISDLSRAQVAELLGSTGYFGGAGSSPRTLGDLWARLEECRRDGYAIADGELDPDVLAVAAPVRDAAQRVVAAITVTGPNFRMSVHRAEVIRLVQQAASICSSAQQRV